MKRTDIDRRLRKAGFVISSGGNHDIARKRGEKGPIISIPRHREINELTAKAILKDAGILEG
ncbi:hypothetical protein FACS1894217_09530 [Clostridia bacterium]|nr:hypothetical protein FACS1894217_09530 [Clostridia bacterium]